MKILFVGPTLHGLVKDGGLAAAPAIICRPPAAQGDIARAVLDGATVIGLVDGRYEDVAAPWHKEILFALQEGVTVLGAGSLGALRAVECEHFGMVGVGSIFERYRSGELVNDSDVAQLHGPAELGNFPITEAFVNIEATLRRIQNIGAIASEDAEALLRLARSLFFKNLTVEALAHLCCKEAGQAERLRQVLEAHRVDVKRADALILVQMMRDVEEKRRISEPPWRMAEPAIWKIFFHRLREEYGDLKSHAKGLYQRNN